MTDSLVVFSSLVNFDTIFITSVHATDSGLERQLVLSYPVIIESVPEVHDGVPEHILGTSGLIRVGCSLVPRCAGMSHMIGYAMFVPMTSAIVAPRRAAPHHQEIVPPYCRDTLI